jgi:single-strand DNA-binding protein
VTKRSWTGPCATPESKGPPIPSLNLVALTGNLTCDPELRSLPSGSSVCSLRLAVNGREKVGDKWTDRANYFDIEVFGGAADNCARYLTKGRPVAVSGRLRWREWQAQDGSNRQAVSIRADEVVFLGGGERSDDLAAGPTPDTSIPF